MEESVSQASPETVRPSVQKHVDYWEGRTPSLVLLNFRAFVDNMDILAKDFVSLPIIITDWDAITDAKSHIKTPKEEIARLHTVSRMATANKQEPELPAFKKMAEEIWNRISDTTKSKIREAALEVLRRTDECRNEKMTFRYDDDARFLD